MTSTLSPHDVGFAHDRHYLIVTRRATDQFREIVGNPNLDEPRIRGVLLATIPHGRAVKSWWDRRGTVRTVDVPLPMFGVAVNVELVWAVNREDGTPSVAPDGVKSMVFVTYICRPIGGTT